MGDADTLLHDLGIILQSLSIISVVFAFHTPSSLEFLDRCRAKCYLGVGARSCIIIFMMIGFAKVLGDLVDMIPQGVLGIWILIVCLRKTGMLPRGLRWLGMTAGLGLALVALFPIGYAFLMDPIILMGGSPSEGYIIEITFANQLLHPILSIDYLMGLPTYSIWTILLGSRLLRRACISVLD